MSLLSDAWLVLLRDAASVLAFAACMLLGGVLIVALLRFFAAADDLDFADWLSLAVGGWIVPVLPVALLVLSLRALAPVMAAVVIAVVLLTAAGGLFWLFRSRPNGRPRSLTPPVCILGGLLLALIPLRLAFVAGLQLPLYFDSAEHYQIIGNLLRQFTVGDGIQRIVWPVTGYYHLGYHVVLAALATLAKLDLAQLMLVSGQLVLAAIPLSMFVLVHRLTRSSAAAILATVLVAFAWYMPAHAVNWGKYPALFSLPVMLFTLAAGFNASEQVSSGGRRRWWIVAVVGALGAFLIHTRAIIVLALIFGAWWLGSWFAARRFAWSLAILIAVCLALVLETVVISRSAAIAPVLDPYLQSGRWLTIAVGLLVVPALAVDRRLAMASLLALACLLGALFVPAPDPAYATLLDRPLVEMILFVPLSVLGAAGFVGVTRHLTPRLTWAKPASAVLVSLGVILHAFSSYQFRPSACCSIVMPDDLTALTWMDSHLPSDARIVIASTEVSYAAAAYPPLKAAADAGAWVAPLTSRSVISLANWTDFSASSTRDLLCAQGATDIYVGSTPQAFDSASMVARPDWYVLAVGIGRARVYHVAGCAG